MTDSYEPCPSCGKLKASAIWVCDDCFEKIRKFIGEKFDCDYKIFVEKRDEWLEQFLREQKVEKVQFT